MILIKKCSSASGRGRRILPNRDNSPGMMHYKVSIPLCQLPGEKSYKEVKFIWAVFVYITASSPKYTRWKP